MPAVNAIHIQWVNPYAVVYVVQYWVGDNNAMDWDMGPNGVWKPFQSGAVLNGSGGDVHLKLSDGPVTTRFIRILMSKSSGTCDTHGAQDFRNCVGYALQKFFAVFTKPSKGEFHGEHVSPRTEGRPNSTNATSG